MRYREETTQCVMSALTARAFLAAPPRPRTQAPRPRPSPGEHPNLFLLSFHHVSQQTRCDLRPDQQQGQSRRSRAQHQPNWASATALPYPSHVQPKARSSARRQAHRLIPTSTAGRAECDEAGYPALSEPSIRNSCLFTLRTACFLKSWR